MFFLRQEMSNSTETYHTIPISGLTQHLLPDGFMQHLCTELGIELSCNGDLVTGEYSALMNLHQTLMFELRRKPQPLGQNTPTLPTSTDHSHELDNVVKCSEGEGELSDVDRSTEECATDEELEKGLQAAMASLDLSGDVCACTVPVEEMLMQLLYRWYGEALADLEQTHHSTIQWQSEKGTILIASSSQDSLVSCARAFTSLCKFMSAGLSLQTIEHVPSVLMPFVQDLEHTVPHLSVATRLYPSQPHTVASSGYALLYGNGAAHLRTGMLLRRCIQQGRRGHRFQPIPQAERSDLLAPCTSPPITRETAKMARRESPPLHAERLANSRPENLPLCAHDESSGQLPAVSASASPAISSDITATLPLLSAVEKPMDSVRGSSPEARVADVEINTTTPNTSEVNSEPINSADRQQLALTTTETRHTPVQTDDCPICYEAIPDGEMYQLPCEHKFCQTCIKEAETSNFRDRCPTCMVWYGVAVGNQPEDGVMSTRHHPQFPLPGYDWCGTIEICYFFEGGVQKKEHPHPGRPYAGLRCAAYLPDYAEGQEVLALLERAFRSRAIFTVGQAQAFSSDDQVLWADIPHKTSVDGGPAG